jgi:hypothetical protein
MTGMRLARVARAVLHEDSFELIVSPALADLQFSPSRAAYVGVWLAFLGALQTDLQSDIHLVLDDAGMLATLVFIQACYYSGILLLLVVGMTGRQLVESLAAGPSPTLIGVLLLIVGLSIGPTLLCFWPPRRTVQDH